MGKAVEEALLALQAATHLGEGALRLASSAGLRRSTTSTMVSGRGLGGIDDRDGSAARRAGIRNAAGRQPSQSVADVAGRGPASFVDSVFEGEIGFLDIVELLPCALSLIVGRSAFDGEHRRVRQHEGVLECAPARAALGLGLLKGDAAEVVDLRTVQRNDAQLELFEPPNWPF